MSEKKIFRLSCSCGCGTGFEMKAAHGTLYVSWFSGDWFAQQKTFWSSAKDRMKYLSGETLLREVVCTKDDLLALKEFLQSVEWEDPEGDWPKNDSVLKPMHLLEDIYAVWLEGTMPAMQVVKGNFHRMFEQQLSPLERDVIISQIDDWISREEKHSIPDGVSPHVTRLAGDANTPEEIPEEPVVELVETQEGPAVELVEKLEESQAQEQTQEEKPKEEKPKEEPALVTCDTKVSSLPDLMPKKDISEEAPESDASEKQSVVEEPTEEHKEFLKQVFAPDEEIPDLPEDMTEDIEETDDVDNIDIADDAEPVEDSEEKEAADEPAE